MELKDKLADSGSALGRERRRRAPEARDALVALGWTLIERRAGARRCRRVALARRAGSAGAPAGGMSVSRRRLLEQMSDHADPGGARAGGESSRLRSARLRSPRFVGQERVKEQLAIALDAAKKRGEALDHVLLAGPPGLGKTSLA